MNQVTPEMIEELKRLEKAATKGPWDSSREGVTACDPDNPNDYVYVLPLMSAQYIAETIDNICEREIDPVTEEIIIPSSAVVAAFSKPGLDTWKPADRDLATAARNALPALLALAEQAHAGRWRQVKEERPPEGVVVRVCYVGSSGRHERHDAADGQIWTAGRSVGYEISPDDWWQPLSLPTGAREK